MTLDFAELKQFTGSETWHRHGLNRSVLFTDGVKYLADQAGAYWLIDEIALAQRYEASIRATPFQVWKLEVKEVGARLSCEDGNEQKVFSKTIEFTDFPAPGITLWCTDNTILLPSEY